MKYVRPTSIRSQYLKPTPEHGSQIEVSWRTPGYDSVYHCEAVAVDYSAVDKHMAAVSEVLILSQDTLIDGGWDGQTAKEWFVCGCSSNGSRSSHWDACVNYREPSSGIIRESESTKLFMYSVFGIAKVTS